MEVNARVNYPIKTILVQMEQNDQINLSCDYKKYCLSWFTMRVAHVGTSSFVQAWNEHRIPGQDCHQSQFFKFLTLVHYYICINSYLGLATFKVGVGNNLLVFSTKYN